MCQIYWNDLAAFLKSHLRMKYGGYRDFTQPLFKVVQLSC